MPVPLPDSPIRWAEAFAVGALLALSHGCSGAATGAPPADAATRDADAVALVDVGSDVAVALDVGRDAPGDGALDVAVDVIADAPGDGARDAALDAVADAAPDAIADAPSDAPPEAAVDAARDAPAEAAPDVASAPSAAVAYQIDPAHTGAQPGVHLALPLARRWLRDLGGSCSYAVVAAGSAFVTVRHGTRYGTSLLALDVATGATRWGPTELGGTYFWSALAYDGGRVFAVNGDGTLRAFDAATGALAWSVQLPGQYSFSAAPTASGGLVFVGGAGSGGTVYAVRQASGEVVWRAPVANGDQSSPAVGGGRVFVSYACNQAYGFDAASGRQLWHHSGGCSGGGGKTTALYAGSLYTRDTPDLVLDAATGAQTGTFTSGPIPAFADGVGYFVGGSTLRAIAVGATAPRWTFTAAGALVTAPIVVGEHVVVAGLAGHLYALSTVDGSVVGADTLPSIAGVDEQNVGAPLSGLSAAEGTLFVPTGSGLAAYNGRAGPAAP